ncbi:MAG: sugar phosphate isomerase/epimerase [bacterium]|nr:sugar phosphate isomerase/epimerase [bacterium]
MLTPGLVSVTFRMLRPEEIVKLTAEAGLTAIEWGGDRHVPHGNVARAREVHAMTKDAGLTAPSYGSYYRVASDDRANPDFEAVLETALELKAETIRVWAGDKGSRETHDNVWARAVRETREIADRAQQVGISISFEFHGNTLNDNQDGAKRLLRGIEHPNVYSYWQPDTRTSFGERLLTLQRLRKRLSNVHVYHWIEGARRPLYDGEEEWYQYLKAMRETGRDHHVLLEFVQDDMPANLIRDAGVLRQLLARISKEA